MGGGTYNFNSREIRTQTVYKSATTDTIFEQNSKGEIHESMRPNKALIRESRDSKEHPESVAIYFALDVTGSMRKIPENLIREGLPKLMEGIIKNGVLHPQVLFTAVGDTVHDTYPYQVGQFESNDVDLDGWLQKTYLEGGGGGNGSESYTLAWYHAAKHTSIDCFEKRGQKGILFTVGDETGFKTVTRKTLENVFKNGEEKESYTDVELLKMAQEKYHFYHLHILEGSVGHSSMGYWKNLLGENCIPVRYFTDIPKIVSDIVVSNTKQILTSEYTPTQVVEDKPTETDTHVPTKPSILL